MSLYTAEGAQDIPAVAREVYDVSGAGDTVIATLGVLFGGDGSIPFSEAVGAAVSAASGLSFLVATMLFVPCAATVAVIQRETGGWRWPAFSVVLHLAISFVAAVVAYHLALFGGSLL